MRIPVYVGTILPTGALDDCLLMRHVTLTVDSSGSLSTTSGPNQFIKDSVTETVTEDTVVPANNLAQPSAMFIYRNGVQLPITHDTATPANTVPVPVQVTDVTGDINITAGDINVQTSHLGVNHDSMRIGDGTNLMGVNASLEALVRDADSITELQAILAKIIAAPSTEAKQDTAITALGSLLTELQLKADLTETQPVSAAALPLPLGAATEATLLAQSAKLPLTLGSKADAASLAVTQSTEDKVVQAAIQTAVEDLSTGSVLDALLLLFTIRLLETLQIRLILKLYLIRELQ